MPAKEPGYAASLKPRPVVEYVGYVYRPLGYLVVRALWRSSLRPEHLVLLHGLLGVAAAALIARGDWVAAAVLLQLVTILDNADGQLARARGQTSRLGRFLDTEVDLLAHLAIFAALARVCGGWVWLGLAALVLVLSLDFNLSRPPGTGREPSAGGAEAALELIYRLVFGWQDYLIGRLEAYLGAAPRWLRVLLANQGRSTQLLLLSIALVAGRPCAYPVYLVILAAGLALVYAVRIWRRIATPSLR